MKTSTCTLTFCISLAALAAGAATSDEEFQKGKAAYTAKSWVEAFHHLTNAAEAGHAEAQLYLGSMYQSDDFGLKRDWDKMHGWFEKAAQGGNPEAAYRLATRERGELIWLDEDYSTSIASFERAAKLGHPKAMAWLAQLHRPDQEHHANQEREVHWTKQAALAGHGESQFRLSQMYHEGYGVERDVASTVTFLKASAANGYDPAQLTYGIALARGDLGLEADKKEGIDWIKLAARNGNAKAYGFLGMAFLTGEGVARDTNLAYSLFVESVRRGEKGAALKLGEVFALGGFGEADVETALTWLHIAELEEHPGAAQAKTVLKQKIGYKPYVLAIAESRAADCRRSDYESRKCRSGQPTAAEIEAMTEVWKSFQGDAN